MGETLSLGLDATMCAQDPSWVWLGTIIVPPQDSIAELTVRNNKLEVIPCHV